jgi:4-amino-4-deoxy-L-arabinose transferase-like glycosyltransferase
MKIGDHISIPSWGLVVLAFVLVAMARILSADMTVPQGFDEPCHVAAGIKWLDRHDYTLDAVHPPLARYAVSVPLFLFGERFPNFRAQDTSINGYCTEIGNAILSDGGRYTRNLFLARIGILPFFVASLVLVFFWTRQEFGLFAACVAAFLFSSLPSILAFSSLAYTDLPCMCTQFVCIFAFAVWLRKPAWGSTFLLGIGAGLAFSSKLTSFLFLPFAATAMLLVKLWFSRDRIRELKAIKVTRLVVAVCVAGTILWSSYAFSIGHLLPALGVSSEVTLNSPHFPGPIGKAIEKLAESNPIIPMPDLLRGMVIARHMNKQAPESYLLGKEKSGGWWYFFPVALALKTPIPFLILSFVGLLAAFRFATQGHWSGLLPAVAVVAIFVATLFVTLRVGTRHVLVALPLLSVLAGYGASLLWQIQSARIAWGRVTLSILLLWQATSSLRAHNDFLAYFNELAPADPSVALVKGCDLDCGQDVYRLSSALRARGVGHVALGIWSSSDVALIGLPPFGVLVPHQPVTGWIAVSVRALQTGQVAFCENGHMLPDEGYPSDALSWLDNYQPVARVGKTILLYDIPQASKETVVGSGP